MRSIALDVHHAFCEVAIKEGTRLRSGGRIRTCPAELELFAQSLAPDDQVALEASGPALAIKRILEPHVGRVVVANTTKLRAIAEAKVKTDKVDARTLCELLAAGFLPAVFSPDEWTRSLRRRLARRSQLVRSRTRAKNELHAVLARNLKGRPPVSDVFGKAGREWLAALALPPRRARDGRGLPASGRLPRRGGRRDRTRARTSSTFLAGDPPTHDGAWGEPHLSCDLRRGGR